MRCTCLSLPRRLSGRLYTGEVREVVNYPRLSKRNPSFPSLCRHWHSPEVLPNSRSRCGLPSRSSRRYQSPILTEGLWPAVPSLHVHISCRLLLVQVAKMLNLLLVCSLTSTVAAKMTEAPVGEWKSPISSQLIVSQSIRLGSPVVAHDGSLIWSEGRPTEGGRQVLVRRCVGCVEE